MFHLRFIGMWPADHGWGGACKRFADLSGLPIEVTSDPGLTDEIAVERMLQGGTLDFTFGAPAALSRFDPAIGDLDTPDGLDAAAMDEAFDRLAAVGIRVLASAVQGPRYLLTRAQPVRRLADFRGLRVRVADGEVIIRRYRALGAIPIPIPWGDVRAALETGQVDALETVTEVILTQRLYEGGRFIVRTSRVLGTLQLLASERTFQDLTSDQRRRVRVAAEQAWREQEIQASADNKAAEHELARRGLVFIDLAP